MNKRRVTLARRRGQGMVEYILIIGLIVLFIVVVLFLFRDAINGFINKAIGWIEGQDVPEAAGSNSSPGNSNNPGPSSPPSSANSIGQPANPAAVPSRTTTMA